MNLLYILFLLLSALCIGKVVESESRNLPPMNHSLNSIITQDGLNMLCKIVSPAIPQMLYESGIPDIEGSANGLNYSLKNFAFGYVDLPGIFASFVDGVGISGGCRDASISLGFDYDFEYTGYPHFEIRDSGGLISIDGMTIGVVCRISSTEDNKEMLTVVGDSLNISDMKIEIGDSSFINIILSIMTPVIKNILEDVIGQVVGGIIETLINPSIGKAVIVSMNNQVRLDNGKYQNIFIDKRLIGDPVFENSMMNVKTNARWFIATYSDPNNISDTTITWDEHEVEYDDSELPYRTTNQQFETVVRSDAWKSLWDSYIRLGYFIGDSTNPTISIKVPCDDPTDESSEACYKNIVVTTRFIEKVLPNIDNLYPENDYDVNFTYELSDNSSLTHQTMYTGIQTGFYGKACLRVKPKVESSDAWDEILCVSGRLELSEIPSLIPGTPNIKLEYHLHELYIDEIVCPICANAQWDGDDIYLATVLYVYYGVIPFLNNWSIDTALVTNIFDGLFLSNSTTLFDKLLGSVSIGGDLLD